VSLAPSDLWAWASTPTGKKAVRYTMVSAISVAVGQAVLFLTFGIMRLGSAVTCNIIATAVATVPSYYLNRWWAWGRTGRSHLWKEIVPFWALAFLGLALSIFAVDVAESEAHRITSSHLGTALIVNAASLAAWGVIWVGKFIILNRLLFVDHEPHRVEALLSRVGSDGD